MTISDEYESLVSAGSLPDSNLISVICKELDRCVAAREHKCEIVINKTSGFQIDDDVFQELLALLKPGLAFIAKIEMRYQTLTDKSIALLVENAKNLENLQVLDLQSCDIEGTMLQGFVRCFKNLRALIFSGNRLLSRAGVELGDSILGSKLEIIELADCGLTEDGIISMFSALHAPNCMIRKLDISGCELLRAQQDIAYHVEDALKINPKLERLHLRKMGLRDPAIERIANGIKFSTNLKYLDLSANKLGMDSAATLCPVLSQLDVLDLSHNRIKSEGAINLANSIVKSGPENKLRTLGLTNTEIGDDGIVALLNAYEKSPLETLLLWGNNFEKDSSTKMTEQMKSGKFKERFSDCRANASWHPDGTPRPAELSHHLRQFYWWTPAKGPEAQRALLQQPGTL